MNYAKQLNLENKISQKHADEINEIISKWEKLAYPEIQEILWDYSNWLHKHGYLDTDYYTEEPHAVDEYLKSITKKYD
jgi:hypothetical protein